MVDGAPRSNDSGIGLNVLCHPRAWDDPVWRAAGRLLALPQHEGWLHRKAFEWTQCIYGLERLGALGPDRTALGVGAGLFRKRQPDRFVLTATRLRHAARRLKTIRPLG